MSDIQNKLVEIITQLQGIVKDNAADAVNLGLFTIRMDGISSIVLSFLCFTFVGVFLWWANKKRKKLIEKNESFDDYPFLFIGIMGGSILAFLFSAGSILCIFNIWTWMAAFEPKLYLAHQVIVKLGG